MAKTGRPRKGEADQETTQVRCFRQMAQQLAELTLVLPLSTAQLLQRVAGANLAELHETHREQIRKVQAAEEAAAAARLAAMAAAAELERQRQRAPARKPRAGS
ncbi:hypothetical protein GobsT_11760 [Gemmata obscuriglobus]|uniref:Uncharacterized protein n=1 Tax=Gemmata obscuriglobus TaxID=114 RepID=A0A2Z3H9P4_9BACT|nr:hypothetical protein [Gemmata obscuriglobus]AWM40346.1 hypothetical protein C1280_27315 [Gemmata obscuriglobus]QEG26437.1 hypothetical protein GobsT_11760 [Gemmata obscuriglobus]VTS01599.1 unnamed protein product [Gemmata obscuriglobus UQM 2246]